jgi:hypothetical protein
MSRLVRMIKSRSMRWEGHGREERHIQGFGGETCRKETTWETQTQMGE